VAFAFAAADLLVEADLDGKVTFAAGAFRMRFGHAPEALVGPPALDLIAAEDQPAFAGALALLPSRGRLAPTMVRMADSARTALVASGLHLALPGQPRRLCLAFSQVHQAFGEEAGMPKPASHLLRDVEARLRADDGAAAPGRLGVVEVLGALPPDILARLSSALCASRPGTLDSAELAPGRIGLLSRNAEDLPGQDEIIREMERLLPHGDVKERVRGMEISLGLDGLSRVQAVRALRHGLSVFTRKGVRGLTDAGFADGLRGFVSKVGSRTRQLAAAVRDRRFHLDYQPILDLRGQGLHHYEALLRPAKDLLGEGAGAAEFVSLAETVGLTEELDLAVLDCAIAALPGLEEGQRIAVNLSGLSVQSEGFRAKMLARIAAGPMAASRLMVELTESAEIEQEDAAAATLEALRAQGIPVCLDDFGAGAAAFRYLKAFAVDYVKVDGAFVQAAMERERDRSFVSSMVDLSLAVGAKVIAERIETAAHAELMQGLGVDYGQGWHLGRPGPLRVAAPAPVQRARRTRVTQESWGRARFGRLE
jgi:EAL domain-containing protein (putative c-di-GMP-specific phosphodiesterase class I)